MNFFFIIKDSVVGATIKLKKMLPSQKLIIEKYLSNSGNGPFCKFKFFFFFFNTNWRRLEFWLYKSVTNCHFIFFSNDVGERLKYLISD